MMTTRLELALTKLYTAFHNGELHPECAKSCAVGNICDNNDSWQNLTDRHGSLVLNYVGRVNQTFSRKINGYLPLELLKIEAEFLKGCGYILPLNYKTKKNINPTDKEVQFNGLCAAIAFLCELDGIPNIMDYSKLFEYENNKPIYTLPEVLNNSYSNQ